VVRSIRLNQQWLGIERLEDISKAHKLAGMIRSGAVWMKCHNVFDASLPFDYYKQSGWGREMSGEARNYTD
jgi:phenylacetaldehyde dehydrogenase